VRLRFPVTNLDVSAHHHRTVALVSLFEAKQIPEEQHNILNPNTTAPTQSSSESKNMRKSFIADGSESSGATHSTAASTLPPSEILRVSPGKYAGEAIQDVDDSESDSDDASEYDTESEYDSESYTDDNSSSESDSDSQSETDSEGDDEEWDNEWDFWILEARRFKAEAERKGQYDTAQDKSSPEELTPLEKEAAEKRVIDNETAVNKDWQEYAEEVIKAIQDNEWHSSDDDSEGEGDDEWESWILEAKRLKAEAERNWYWYPEDSTLIEEADERAIDIEAAVNRDWQVDAEEVVKAVQDDDGSEGDDEWDFWILEAKRWKADAERNWSILQLVA
jgi:hypothetical protein